MVVYHIIPLLVATLAFTKGYKKGFMKQIPNLIGFCFGIICAHIFSTPVEEILRSFLPAFSTHTQGHFFYSVFSRGLTYIIVYRLLSFCTGFLKIIFSSSPEILGRISGSIFCSVRWVLMLSVVYNMWLGINPRSELLKYAKSDDGNIVEMTMLYGTAILGGDSVEDLAHKLQLEEAKSIS